MKVHWRKWPDEKPKAFEWLWVFTPLGPCRLISVGQWRGDAALLSLDDKPLIGATHWAKMKLPKPPQDELSENRPPELSTLGCPTFETERAVNIYSRLPEWCRYHANKPRLDPYDPLEYGGEYGVHDAQKLAEYLKGRLKP